MKLLLPTPLLTRLFFLVLLPPFLSIMAAGPGICSAATRELAAGPAVDLLLLGGPDYCVNCTVYVGAEAGVAEQYAADELVAYLNQAHIPIRKSTEYDPKAGPYIIIGTDNDYTSLLSRPLDSTMLGEDGFELRRQGKDLLIAGGRPRGTLNGVYHFLRDYVGVEWYAADTVKIPDCSAQAGVPIPSSTQIRVPRFLYRLVFNPEAGENPDSSAFADNDDDTAGGDTAARFTLNGQYGHKSDYIEEGIGYHRGILREKHGFGLNVLDVFNIENEPGTAAATRDAALGDLRAKAAYRQVFGQDGLWYPRLGHIDGSSRSDDPNDLALVAANGGAAGAPLFDLVARTATAIADEFPRAVVLGEAYLWSLKPPTNITLPPNAGVDFAPIEMDWSCSLNSSDNSVPAGYLREWTNHTDHIRTWLYSTNFSGYLQPLPTIYPMIDTIKYLDTIPDVEGVFLQDSGSPGGSFAALHTWLYSRLLWNPHLDGSSLVREFCNGYYGPKAGPLIHQYILDLHASQQANPGKISTKIGITAPYLHAAFIIKADARLHQAEGAAADNALYLRHVQIERMGIDWVILHNGERLCQEAEQLGLTWPDNTPEKRQQRLDRFTNTVRNIARMEAFGEDIGTIDDMLAALAVVRSIAQPTNLCSPENDCREYLDLDFELSDAQLVNDARASDNFAARMPGDKPSWHDGDDDSIPWGIQVPFSRLITEPGQWDVYVDIRVDKGASPAAGAKALSLGADPGPHYREPAIETLDDENYHTLRLTNSPYHLDQGAIYGADGQRVDFIWFQPPGSDTIDYMYVDRVFIVPATVSALVEECPAGSGFSSTCRVVQDYGLMTYMESSSLVADATATDGYAAHAPGGLSDNPWLITLPLDRILPATGQWDLYAAIAVRHTENTSDDEELLVAGIEGVGAFPITDTDLNGDQEYHLLQLPGTRYTAAEDQQRTLYFQSANPKTRLFVDYILAVPAPPEE